MRYHWGHAIGHQYTHGQDQHLQVSTGNSDQDINLVRCEVPEHSPAHTHRDHNTSTGRYQPSTRNSNQQFQQDEDSDLDELDLQDGNSAAGGSESDIVSAVGNDDNRDDHDEFAMHMEDMYYTGTE